MAAPDGKHCPNCGDDIGVRAVFSARSPSEITCPHCGAALTYGDIRGLILALMGIAVIVVVGSLYVIFQVGALPTFLAKIAAFGAVVVVVGTAVEFIVASYLRTYKVLTSADGKS